jgi:hypothetical protein
MKIVAIILFLIPAFAFADTCSGVYEVKLDGVELRIEQKLFSPSEHHIEYYDGGNGVEIPTKIDGKNFIPNGFEMPYCQVMSVKAIFKGKTYKLNTTGLYDFWDSRYPAKVIDYVSCLKEQCVIETVLGDGVGTFLVGWKFGVGIDQEFTLTQDEKLIYEFMENNRK